RVHLSDGGRVGLKDWIVRSEVGDVPPRRARGELLEQALAAAGSDGQCKRADAPDQISPLQDRADVHLAILRSQARRTVRNQRSATKVIAIRWRYSRSIAAGSSQGRDGSCLRL